MYSLLIVASRQQTYKRFRRIVGKAGYLTHGCWTDVTEAKTAVSTIQPDLLLVDAGFDNRNGLDFARRSMLAFPHLRCVIFGPPEPIFVLAALQVDLSGYLPADPPPKELLTCLELVGQRYRYLTPSYVGPLTLPESTSEQELLMARLSPRETEIMQCLRIGLTGGQIAEKLHISPATVNGHKQRMTEKLDLKSRRELIRLAANLQPIPE